MKKLLDNENGLERWFHSDDGQHSVETKQDIQPELEASREMRNDESHWKDGVKKGFVQYAHIPTTILEQWRKQGVDINDNQELFKMVNKPEWQILKTTTKNHESKSTSSTRIHLPKAESWKKH